MGLYSCFLKQLISRAGPSRIIRFLEKVDLFTCDLVFQVHRAGQSQYSQAQYHRCLLNSYRVGMLALETLARRVHDDRPQAKYARNPPYGEDVKWLLRVSKKLGMLHRI